MKASSVNIHNFIFILRIVLYKFSLKFYTRSNSKANIFLRLFYGAMFRFLMIGRVPFWNKKIFSSSGRFGLTWEFLQLASIECVAKGEFSEALKAERESIGRLSKGKSTLSLHLSKILSMFFKESKITNHELQYLDRLSKFDAFYLDFIFPMWRFLLLLKKHRRNIKGQKEVFLLLGPGKLNQGVNVKSIMKNTLYSHMYIIFQSYQNVDKYLDNCINPKLLSFITNDEHFFKGFLAIDKLMDNGISMVKKSNICISFISKKNSISSFNSLLNGTPHQGSLSIMHIFSQAVKMKKNIAIDIHGLDLFTGSELYINLKNSKDFFTIDERLKSLSCHSVFKSFAPFHILSKESGVLLPDNLLFSSSYEQYSDLLSARFKK
jgi:hypothetical protein